MALPVQMEIIQFNIVNTNIVKGVFHMILDIVKGNQNELRDHYDKINHDIAMSGPDIINDSGSIDQRKDVNEYQAVGLQCPWGPVDVNGEYILKPFLHVIHIPENPVLSPSGNKLFQFCDEGVEFMDGLVYSFHVFRIVFKVVDCFIADL